MAVTLSHLTLQSFPRQCKPSTVRKQNIRIPAIDAFFDVADAGCVQSESKLIWSQPTMHMQLAVAG